MANTLNLGDGNWATKEDLLLGYNSENNNYKPLPFDFSRESSATRVNKDGLIETVGRKQARIDYKDNTKGALLLEPSRTNKLTTSQDFSSYLKSGTITTTANYGISPNGKQDSTRVVFSSSNSAFYKLSVHSGNTETNSIYIKGTNGETIRFGKGATVNLGDTFTLNGEWQRLEYVSTTGNQFIINTYGGTTARDIEIFGAQIEEGSYPTSYIPTQGTVQTRLAETNIQTPPDGVIGQTEGTLFAQVGEFPKEHNGRIFAIGDGSADDYITIIKNGSNNNFAVYVDTSGVAQVAYQGSGTLSNNSKIAVGYKNNNYAIYVNGTQVHTDTNASVPSLVKIFIGSRENGSSTFILGGSITETKLYNTRLSNSELAALTQV